ncbi:hypothetical protein BaRGS_00030701 [Batillaria attramentaria]|uniref:AIG1-type G domain-containing protein n=1 Tax=Batillaria attramentaria TaxID=370345 RepID=A0ABD0JSG1_9CAEN
MASRYRQLQSEDCKAVRNEGTREDREPPPEPQDGEETASPSTLTDTVDDKGFVVSESLCSQTKTCEYKTSTSAWGRYLKVVDTPGLFDTEESLAVTLNEMTNVLSLCLPGPHAVLFVIRLDVKFTQEENDAFKLILKMFEEEKVKKHLILVFTRGSDKIRCPIEQFLSDAPATLKEILDLVGDNYAVISKTSDKNVREQQVRHLLEKIDKVSNNGRDYYVNKDMEKMNTVMAEEIEKVMKERQMTYQQAEFAVKNGLAHDDKKFWTFKKKLILLVVASVAFAVLGGVLGATVAVFAVGADITEAVVGAGVPMATTILSAVGIGIKEYAKTQKEKCVIL